MLPQNSPVRLTLHLRIHGRVQGVFFRESMRVQADSLGISGWVRNRADGTVEAVIQGEPRSIEKMFTWTRRGPERAQVARVDTETAAGEFSGFEKRQTN